MPHIRTDRLRLPPFPYAKGDVRFAWYAANVRHPDEGLLKVSVSGIPFFLQIKPKGKTWLIKAEKITRPSPNALIKRALKSLVEATGMPLLYENISNLDEAKLTMPLECLKEVDRFDPEALPDKPLWIEVGFGSGRHLLHQAKAHPNVHLIGLEIHRPSLEQVMRRIDLEGLENVWVVDYDARLFMELLPSDRVERIFVHFPVPWDKKPHRRIISEAFIDEAMRVLSPGGTLELRTDSENYFTYAMGLFLQRTRLKLSLEKNLDGAVRSKYEDRWLRLGKNIYEVHASALESSPPKRWNRRFAFRCAPDFDALVARIPEKARVAKDHFYHVERLYRIENEAQLQGVVRVSFGSFDRPEHKYLLIGRDGVDYFPHAPVPTHANRAAHEALEEWLCPTS